jgi:hypothetical protein
VDLFSDVAVDGFEIEAATQVHCHAEGQVAEDLIAPWAVVEVLDLSALPAGVAIGVPAGHWREGLACLSRS